jgi:hypothetical protein
MYHASLTVFSLQGFTFLFVFRNETFPDIPEKHPVQDKVDDQQSSEYQARVIMHGYPLVTGDAKVSSPAASPPPRRGEQNTGQARR